MRFRDELHFNHPYQLLYDKLKEDECFRLPIMSPLKQIPFFPIGWSNESGGFFEELAKIIYEMRDDWPQEQNTFMMSMYVRSELIYNVEGADCVEYAVDRHNKLEVLL